MITLIFGMFDQKWVWSVEWHNDFGRVCFKDFVQKDFQPGVAKADADAFKEAMLKSIAA